LLGFLRVALFTEPGAHLCPSPPELAFHPDLPWSRAFSGLPVKGQASYLFDVGERFLPELLKALLVRASRFVLCLLKLSELFVRPVHSSEDVFRELFCGFTLAF
jgi:hypothetical protein